MGELVKPIYHFKMNSKLAICGKPFDDKNKIKTLVKPVSCCACHNLSEGVGAGFPDNESWRFKKWTRK